MKKYLGLSLLALAVCGLVLIMNASPARTQTNYCLQDDEWCSLIFPLSAYCSGNYCDGFSFKVNNWCDHYRCWSFAIGWHYIICHCYHED